MIEAGYSGRHRETQYVRGVATLELAEDVFRSDIFEELEEAIMSLGQ